MGGPGSALNQFLHKLITEEKNNIVVDLNKVDFINSSGLGMLIGGINNDAALGGELKLARATKKVENLLEMTKLLKVFDLHKNVDNAIASFK